jgi:predicted nucleic acid-binding protein
VVVVDASVALGWALPELAAPDEYGDRVALAARKSPGLLVAPRVFAAECCHALLKNGRRLRHPAEAIESMADDIDCRGILLMPGRRGLIEQVSFALRHHVQGYDAHYLALALSIGAELATADRGLRAAAERAGVPLFS